VGEREGRMGEEAVQASSFSLPKALLSSLSAAEHQLHQWCIPRDSLLNVHETSWRKLYCSYNNQALSTATGLDHPTFEYLLGKFQPIFDSTTPFGSDDERYIKTTTRGRERIVLAMDCLGLVLVLTRTQGSFFIADGFWFVDDKSH
jgi:hypothetical protein